MNLPLECPECACKLSPLIGVYRHATDHYQRTCGKCGWRWRIKVVPTENPRFMMHTLSFHALSNRDDRQREAKVATQSDR